MAKKSARAGSSVTASLGSIVKHFELLPDPRHHCNRLHFLADVITIAGYGVIVGCDGPTAIAIWARAKQDWLKELLKLPNGIPSRECTRLPDVCRLRSRNIGTSNRCHEFTRRWNPSAP